MDFTDEDINEVTAEMKLSIVIGLKALDDEVCREMAAYCRRLYNALVAEGFSPTEAGTMAVSMAGSTGGKK